MHDPCFGANIVHGGEIGLDEGGEVSPALVILERLVCESAIVMWMESMLA